MRTRPSFDLIRLRHLGWSLWDPISLRHFGNDAWKDEEQCADEYDTYLLKAAASLWDGASESQVASYLEDIEVNCIGLACVEGVHERALTVAAALRTYVQSLKV